VVGGRPTIRTEELAITSGVVGPRSKSPSDQTFWDGQPKQNEEQGDWLRDDWAYMVVTTPDSEQKECDRAG
jgi:hypothetical protein